MGTSFPGGVDSFPNPTSGNPQNSPDHAVLHTNVNAAVEAVETWLLADTPGWMATSTYDPANIAQQVVGTAAAQTLTNKRITARNVVVSVSATPSLDTDNGDVFTITSLNVAITSFTTNLTGTPVDGDIVEFRITDNGTARALAFGAKFASTTTATLPATTIASTLMRLLFQWNGTAGTWDCISSSTNFALPVPEKIYANATASGSVTLQDPTTTLYTIQVYTVPNSDTLTLANWATANGSAQVRIVTGTGTTITFPSTNTRWAGGTGGAGTAPTVGASETWDFAVKCIDGTHYDWAFTGRFA